MSEQHIVPLSRQAVEILREFQPLTNRGRYVFPSLLTRDRPMSGNTINAALRQLGYDADVQIRHGFRSMASTLLNEQGFLPDVIELQLGHAERNKAQRLGEKEHGGVVGRLPRCVASQYHARRKNSPELMRKDGPTP